MAQPLSSFGAHWFKAQTGWWKPESEFINQLGEERLHIIVHLAKADSETNIAVAGCKTFPCIENTGRKLLLFLQHLQNNALTYRNPNSHQMHAGRPYYHSKIGTYKKEWGTPYFTCSLFTTTRREPFPWNAQIPLWLSLSAYQHAAWSKQSTHTHNTHIHNTHTIHTQ